jgi:hypothetical protein
MAEWDPEDYRRADLLTRMLKRFYHWLFPDHKDQKARWRFGGEKDFLCDTCRYNYGSSCSQPDRPNAIKCRDYKKS